jgi:hypothetical protein
MVDNVGEFCNKILITIPESYLFGGIQILALELPLKRIDERRMRVW